MCCNLKNNSIFAACLTDTIKVTLLAALNFANNTLKANPSNGCRVEIPTIVSVKTREVSLSFYNNKTNFQS